MNRRRAGPPTGSSKARERIEEAIDAAQGELTRTRLAAYCDDDPLARERLLASVADLERQVDALWAGIMPPRGDSRKSRKTARKPKRKAAAEVTCRRSGGPKRSAPPPARRSHG
jgi:hypothetical protein